MTQALSGIASFSEQAVDYVKTPYTALVKSTRCAKTLHAFIGEVGSVSEFSTRIFDYIAPLKIIHVPVYSVKSVQSATSLVTCEGHGNRIFNSWKLYSSLKKLTSGAEAVVACISQVTPVTSTVYKAFTVLGFVFLPNTTIEAVIGTYKTIERIKLYRQSETHFASATDEKTAQVAVKYFKDNSKEFSRFKICTEKNSLLQRIDDVTKGLEKDQVDSKTIEQVNELFCSIKKRMQHLIVHETMRTIFKVVSITTFILSMCTGVGMVTITALELATATGRLGAFMYGKYAH